MGGQLPNIDFQILSAWGFPDEGESFYTSAASGLVFGTNPPYQLDDFLAAYPKFGTQPQGVMAASVSSGGQGFAVGDRAVIVQPDANGCLLTVAAIGANGAVTAFTVSIQGQGYSVANGLTTTAVSPSLGTGLTVNVLIITPANLQIPSLMMQMFINLASASLIQARWLDQWQFAMGLFVAHFCTLWLASEGNPGSTPGAIARSGLALGIIVSHSEGEVSKSIEPPDLGEFDLSWGQTIYGQQLVTMAKVVGMGPLFLY